MSFDYDAHRELMALKVRVAKLEALHAEPPAPAHGAPMDSMTAEREPIEKQLSDLGWRFFVGDGPAAEDVTRGRNAAQGAPAEPLSAECHHCEDCGTVDHCDHCGNPMDGNVTSTSDVCFDCWRAMRAKLAAAERERDEAVLLLRPHRFEFHGVDDFLNRHDAAVRAIRDGRPAPTKETK